MRKFCEAVGMALLLVLVSVPIADAQQTLPPVNVTANACGYGITCIYPGGGLGDFLIPIAGYKPPMVPGVPKDAPIPLLATCKSLRDYANTFGCNTNDPPPAPLYPSPTRGNWVSNGCGDGSAGMDDARSAAQLVPGFTGDFTTPFKGVSFATSCSKHDSCYYHGNKIACDNALFSNLAHDCTTQASGVTYGACIALAAAYRLAVSGKHGQDAYNSDQFDWQCAKISSDLRRGNCVAS